MTDNELLAEFMGGTHEARDIMTVGGKRTGKWTFPNGLWCYDDQLDFDKSWDRLMPVVLKAHEIGDEKVRELPEGKEIDDPTGWRSWSYRRVHLDTDINKVYQELVEFIKWYNENKKP